MNSQLSFSFSSEVASPKSFRPIHYLGSKLRILDFISKTIDEIDSSKGRVCDLFAGSGTVSYHLSRERDVTAIDIQEYSNILCSALLFPVNLSDNFYIEFKTFFDSTYREQLEWAVAPLIEYETFCTDAANSGNSIPLCELLEKGSIIAFELGYSKDCSKLLNNALQDTISRLKSKKLFDAKSLTVRYAGGAYFSYYQAVHFDVLLEYAASLPNDIKTSFMAATLSTASDLVNTVGKQFAQPIQPRKSDGTPKSNLGKRVQKDRNLSVYDYMIKWLNKYTAIQATNYTHQVYKMDYLDALEHIDDELKVVYADPPYTRDHYSRYYHILETLCLRDSPQVSTTFIGGETKISRGLYREGRHQSPFCIKSQAPAAFEALIKNIRNREAALMVSYSPYDVTKKARPRLLTIEQLEKLAKKYYRHVEFVSAGKFSHSKFNSVEKNFQASEQAEVLMVCLV